MFHVTSTFTKLVVNVVTALALPLDVAAVYLFIYLLTRISLFVLLHFLTDAPILTKCDMMVYDLPTEVQDTRKPLSKTGNTPRKFLDYCPRTVLIIVSSEKI
jgi:hypothetical protein